MALPLFPLPNLVLFPGVVLPLYVFEERYRALLRDIQAGDEPFGIVQIIETDGHEDRARPFHERVSRVGTLAHLQQAQTHDDGTSSIVVVGGERFVVEDFAFDKPYLSATVREWPLDPDPLGPVVTDASARQLLADLLRLHSDQADTLRRLAPADPLLLASFAASALPLDGGQREQALVAPTLQDRLDTLLGFVPTGAKELN